ASVMPLLESGKRRALAVLGAKRASFMPSVPTLDESGLRGYDRSTWYGMLAPAAVPKQIISRLNTVVSEAVNTPEMKAVLIKEGLEPQAYTPEQFAMFIQKEIAQNATLAEMAKDR
ncbi:MAG: tripartite tricarboxylate transporter substrate-binding protein, partial [Pseudomonadota bacterium]